MARSAMKVSIVDKGLGAVLARLISAASQDAGVEAGSIGGGKETATIARVHELGLGNNPQRSYLRATVARHRVRYAELSRRAFGKYMDGDWTLAQALTALGVELQSDIKKAIIKSIAPALKLQTITRKRRLGMPRPRTALYATGKFYESIKFRLKGVR